MKFQYLSSFVAVVAAAFTSSSLVTAAMPAQQAYLKASNTDSNDTFGTAVAISGDTMVVGAPGEASNSPGVNGDQSNNGAPSAGAAYVFVPQGTNWSQQAYLKPGEPCDYDEFGRSVAIAGDTIVVGEPGSDSAYIFVRTGTNWSQQASLKAFNLPYAYDFGIAVAISGNTVVVGAVGESSTATGVNGNPTNYSATSSGAAYVFVRTGATWTQQAYLKASNTGMEDNFGNSVAVSGDTVMVGAHYEQSSARGVNPVPGPRTGLPNGAAYVFTRNGTNWSQQAYLKASNTAGPDALDGGQFGISVSLSGDTAVVGAWAEDSGSTGVNGDQFDHSGGNAGAAYVFDRTGTNWSQQAYLKPSSYGDGCGDFGWSVAVSGDTIVAGARDEASNATGIDGDQTDTSAGTAGAAYVFVRRGTNWSQQAYLKASNTDACDEFGWAVAVSGDTVIVGADEERSNATGVAGNQADNSAASAGAAYVFTGFGVGPQLAIARDGSGGYFIRLAGISGFTYQLQRAPSVTGPWTTNATITASISGPLEFHDTNALPGHAFYRTTAEP